MRALLFLSLTLIFASPAAQARGEWQLFMKTGAEGCKGYMNRDECNLICIHAVGEDAKGKYNNEKGCMKAKYVKTEEQFLKMRARMMKLQEAMNARGFKGWTQEELERGFYHVADKYAPENTGAGGGAVSTGSGTR